MRKLGIILFILGAGSIALYFLGREFVILKWINTWGERTGWAIRIGVACAGGIMILLGGGKKKEEKK